MYKDSLKESTIIHQQGAPLSAIRLRFRCKSQENPLDDEY